MRKALESQDGEALPLDENASVEVEDRVWGGEVSRFNVFSRNVSLGYLVLATQMVIGVVMLPFNVSHLGQSDYGLWVLTASITMYFSVFDLGYGVAQVKFAAE